jgi:hypothetical protein
VKRPFVFAINQAAVWGWQNRQIAGTGYRVGQGPHHHLIKAQLQTTEILKEHAIHHQEKDRNRSNSSSYSDAAEKHRMADLRLAVRLSLSTRMKLKRFSMPIYVFRD